MCAYLPASSQCFKFFYNILRGKKQQPYTAYYFNSYFFNYELFLTFFTITLFLEVIFEF